MSDSPVAIVDLFSGPGGLAEGFVPLVRSKQDYPFHLELSVDSDPIACSTLRLRSFLRKTWPNVPSEYYQFLNEPAFTEPNWSALFPDEWELACRETRCLELGTSRAKEYLQQKLPDLRKVYGGNTMLLGGPPCQSYSLVGRARNAGNPRYEASKDGRHSLYLEFCSALTLLQPAIAILENVRGLISAKHDGQLVFPKIMESLSNAGGRQRYQLFTLNPDAPRVSWRDGLIPSDFLVRAEKHGVPQARHRVFVVCIRKDLAKSLPSELLPRLAVDKPNVSLQDVIGNMPILRSKLSRGDSAEVWRNVVRQSCRKLKEHCPPMNAKQTRRFHWVLDNAMKSTENRVLASEGKIGGVSLSDSCPKELRHWLVDRSLRRLPNNETRGHLQEDITRYLFAAVFSYTFKKSPIDADFPKILVPKHASWNSGKFSDRFRVQLSKQPSTTITSHISKDGHYYIHPDPKQCRALTVREAARLQTFPDNYFFQGARTQQYVQVGNAVPPYLAYQIATEVAKVFQHHEACVLREKKRSEQSPSNKSSKSTNGVKEFLSSSVEEGANV